MKPLNVRFSDSTKAKLSELSSEVGVSDSVVARAAMQIGLEFIESFDDSQQECLFSVEEYLKLKSLESK